MWPQTVFCLRPFAVYHYDAYVYDIVYGKAEGHAYGCVTLCFYFLKGLLK